MPLCSYKRILSNLVSPISYSCRHSRLLVAWIRSSKIRMPLWRIPINSTCVTVFSQPTWSDMEARRLRPFPGQRFIITFYRQMRPYMERSHNRSRALLSRMFFPSRSRVSYMIMRIIRPLPTHLLASLCVLVAGVTLRLHWLHVRQRRDIYLTHMPGSIGSAVALTSHSGFGQLLMPYDDRAAYSRALAPLSFRLDRRTGAIVVDDSTTLADTDSMEMTSLAAVKDETMPMAILGGRGRVWGAVKRRLLGRAWWRKLVDAGDR